MDETMAALVGIQVTVAGSALALLFEGSPLFEPLGLVAIPAGTYLVLKNAYLSTSRTRGD